MVYYPTVGTIVGAWAGAIVIPLDWDRPWQVIQLIKKIKSNIM
jgi:hypothetical protein